MSWEDAAAPIPIRLTTAGENAAFPAYADHIAAATDYKSAHVETLRARKQWFEQIEGPILALWWIPAGQIPTVQEAQERLQHLKDHGPTPHAFTFRTTFPAPDGHPGDADGLDAVFCEWASRDLPPPG